MAKQSFLQEENRLHSLDKIIEREQKNSIKMKISTVVRNQHARQKAAIANEKLTSVKKKERQLMNLKR
jgi:hypothetical protein